MALRQTSPGFNDERYRRVIELMRARRKELGLTQQEVADRIGLHRQFVSRVELGERRIDVVELVDLAAVLDLDPVTILGAIPLRDS